MNDPAVELLSVHKTYGPAGSESDQVVAVYDVNLSIASGEFFTLLGPSGCGKTTTLRMLAGFEDPTSGEILILKRSMNDVPANRRPVNMVFQNYALFPHLSVADNVAFGLSVRGVAKQAREQRVEKALELVQLGGYQQRRPSQLSGGQQQRVALARALINEPQVLLLDEPLGALDLKLRKTMQLELKGLQAQLGITFVYVTHDQEEALTMSDRIAVMSKGRVLQVGSAREVYQRPASRFVADFIGESNFLEGQVAADTGQEITVRIGDQLVRAAARSNSFSVGDPISLAVRPERMEITPGGRGVLDGHLEDVVFVGTDTRFIVRLPSGQAVAVRRQNSSGEGEYAVEIGQSVGISWDPQDAWALDD